MKNKILLSVLATLALAAFGILWMRQSSPEPVAEPGSLKLNAAGIVIGGLDPNPDGGPALDIDNIIRHADDVVVVSRDLADTFTVPVPGDPEWEDYLEYRRHFRTSLDDDEGFVVAYDPEWRSQVTGRRQNVREPFLELYGGAGDLGALASMVVTELNHEDEHAMLALAIRKEEFEEICWPAFPQSRPFLRIPWEEAWGMHYATMYGGIKEGVRESDAMNLVLESVGYEKLTEYDYFRVYEGVVIQARDERTGESREFRFVDSVIERNGVFKVFLYKD